MSPRGPKIAVCGLWHLGSVTAAGLSSLGFEVVGLDDDAATVAALAKGKAPISEPQLDETLAAGLAAGTLRFTSDPRAAVEGAAVLWITWDTPVDENDVADTAFVTDRVRRLFPLLAPGAVLVTSSQLPVGTARTLEAAYREQFPQGDATFAVIPENLRLGQAMKVFLQPDRIVVGADAVARARLQPVLERISPKLQWLSPASAEMSKHAINAFLATSVVFANELAVLCEQVGADAKEVEAALKSEERIGPKAYVSPGGAFAGGTLARDIAFLNALAARTGRSVPLFKAVPESNQRHKAWTLERLAELFGGKLEGRRLGVLGLTYKANTDTLRRSSSVELCRALHERGAKVVAHDPGVKALPPELAFIELAASAAALGRLDALVVMTGWPQFKELDFAPLLAPMAQKLVVDPNRFLFAQLKDVAGLRYYTIGKAA